MTSNRYHAFLLALFLIMALITALSGPAHAQKLSGQKVEEFLKTWMPYLYGEDGEVGPEDTMIAPFADESVKQMGHSNISELPVHAVPLNTAHKSYEEVRLWVTEAISQALSFNHHSYQSHFILMESVFSPSALEEYKAFIESTRIKDKVIAAKSQVSGFVADQPLLINEGVVDGRYRWLFDIPMSVSFISGNATSFKDSDADTYYIKMRLQVGRVGADIQPDGLIIETWKAATNFSQTPIE